MRKIIIAIDGFSACGKSTTAKLVANHLNYAYIDTGAMYRAVTLYFCQNYVELTNQASISRALENIHINFVYNAKTGKSETYLNGLNVEEEIRKMYISEKVSQVSAVPDVRKAMVRQQQKMGKKRGIVMDGRDIGTCVFPEAELKIFMTADILVRAKRRQQELFDKQEMVPFEDIIKNLQMRDHLDTTRMESPLKMASDAFLLDTTFITVDEQIDMVVNLATSRMIHQHAADLSQSQSLQK